MFLTEDSRVKSYLPRQTAESTKAIVKTKPEIFLKFHDTEPEAKLRQDILKVHIKPQVRLGGLF